ncbi:MAG: hypothetical protein ACI9IL_000766 [Rickettsiales bacterium]|jgi:hypothetical protein
MKNHIIKALIIISILTLSSCNSLRGIEKIEVSKTKSGNLKKTIFYKNNNLEAKIFDKNNKLIKETSVTYSGKNIKSLKLMGKTATYSYHPNGAVKSYGHMLYPSATKSGFLEEKNFDNKGNLTLIKHNVADHNYYTFTKFVNNKKDSEMILIMKNEKREFCLKKYFNFENEVVKTEKC